MKIFLTLMAIFSPTTTIIANTTCYENKQDNNANYQIGFQSSTENNKIDSATKENNKLRYRVYIDRSADELPKRENSIDYNYYDVPKRDTWKSGYAKILSVDTEKFQFDLDKVTINYNWASNLWNSSKGWTISGGKNISLSPKSYEYKLSKHNKTKLVSLDSSESHSNNEKTKLEIKESWDKSVLSLEWVISVYYNWKNLSLVSHAALAMLENEKININQSDLNIDTSFKSEQNFFSTKIKAGSTEKVSLKPLFNEARNLYKKSVSQGWTEMYIVQTLYARTGAVNGIFLAGYAHFALIYLQALMEDINIALQTGVQGSAEINFLYSKTNALMVYYTDLTGKRIDLGNLDGFPTSSPGLVWSGVDNYLMTTMYKTKTN